ncbi:MAG: hypothetical protein ACK5LC_08930 [Coprobacillaceae bacterium]
MYKKIITILSPIFFLLTFINTSLTIQAIDYYQLQESSVAYWNDQGTIKTLPDRNSNQIIPYGSTLRFDISVSNTNGNINTQISFYKKQGISFLEYYPGVLKINGANASLDQYNAFISDGGLSTTLTSTNTIFSLEVKSTGTSNQKVSGDMKIFSNDVTVGKKQVQQNMPFTVILKKKNK